MAERLADIARRVTEVSGVTPSWSTPVLSRQELGESLVAAATDGDVELCAKLLLSGADVNYQTAVCGSL